MPNMKLVSYFILANELYLQSKGVYFFAKLSVLKIKATKKKANFLGDL